MLMISFKWIDICFLSKWKHRSLHISLHHWPICLILYLQLSMTHLSYTVLPRSQISSFLNYSCSHLNWFIRIKNKLRIKDKKWQTFSCKAFEVSYGYPRWRAEILFWITRWKIFCQINQTREPAWDQIPQHELEHRWTATVFRNCKTLSKANQY